MKLAFAIRSGLVLSGLALAGPARADIVSSGADWFELSNTATVPQTPDVVWRALLALPKWWDAAHTYSGKAQNLSLTPKVGGCFCEIIPEDGSQIEHGRIVFLRPKSALRLYAALGPLQALGVTGNLTYTLKLVDGGTELRQTYIVTGHMAGGLSALAGPVSSVMGLQFGRLAAYAADRKWVAPPVTGMSSR